LEPVNFHGWCFCQPAESFVTHHSLVASPVGCHNPKSKASWMRGTQPRPDLIEHRTFASATPQGKPRAFYAQLAQPHWRGAGRAVS
jgi:hypothetical protein